MTQEAIQCAAEVKNALIEIATKYGKETTKPGEFLFSSIVGILMVNEELAGKELSVREGFEMLKQYIQTGGGLS